MPRADRVPFVPGRALVAVHVVLNERDRFVMLVDTGAERTLLSRSAAERLGLDTTRPIRVERLVGVGESPPSPVVRLDRVRVGASVVLGIHAAVFDLPPVIQADGLLGLSFLRRFRVTFAFDRSELILREPRPAATA